MTTNHRPTLESKKGKKRAIGDSIVHVRAVKQHTELKYRTDVRKYDIDQEEVKQFNKLIEEKDVKHDTDRVLNGQGVGNSGTKGVETKGGAQNDNGDSNDDSNDENDDNDRFINETSSRSQNENDDEDEDENENESNGSDTDSDSDSDTEELLAELEKIKKEKEQKQQQTLSSNPLLSSQKKSWRNSAFKKKPQKDNSKEFTTDSLDSDYHKKFMKKFIR